MDIVQNVKDYLRPVKNIYLCVCGFSYDFYRFIRYSGWIVGFGDSKRDYRAVKIYHRLEKSLSFRNRRLNSGREAVEAYYKLCNEPSFGKNQIGFQESAGIKVVKDFLKFSEFENENLKEITSYFNELEAAGNEGGVLDYSVFDLNKGVLSDPETFFNSRYSIRDFSEKKVDAEIILRAARIALKSPSVCNRQAWHIYHLDEREVIDQTLSLQNGNRGFGHEVPCLLILASDLEAFDTAGERYQHWIDGGMFAMSIVLALHSLGLGSCCLNWSKVIADDIALRSKLNIKGSHSILMMLAVGYARDTLKVCVSPRRPLSEIYTFITKD